MPADNGSFATGISVTTKTIETSNGPKSYQVVQFGVPNEVDTKLQLKQMQDRQMQMQQSMQKMFEDMNNMNKAFFQWNNDFDKKGP